MRSGRIHDAANDIFIGLIIALISIPISMGYASVAGLPVVYGLYGSLFPVIIFGIVSSSPGFVFGVDAAPAALVAGMLAALDIAAGSYEALQIIPVVTLIVAALLLIYYLLRADRLLKYISQAVMGGFVTGIGCTIILMQIPRLFGGTPSTGEVIELLQHIFHESVSGFSIVSFILGIATIAVIIMVRKKYPRFPIQPVMMLLGIILARFTDVEGMGVATLPAVEKGLPLPKFPDAGAVMHYFPNILLPGVVISLVILSETLLATANLARKRDQEIKERREILAYSLGNFSAAAFGVCPVNGSISRSGIAAQFGAKGRLMPLSAGLFMVVILLFGTDYITYLPVPILTGIVIASLIGTLEFDLAKKFRKTDKTEYLVFYAAFASVLLFGTIYGVIVGVLLSQVIFISRQAKPNTAFLGLIEGVEGFHSLKGHPGLVKPLKGVLIYRFTGPLFYANIDQFVSELKAEVRDDTKVVIVDASGIGSIDMSASERLMYIYHRLKDRGISFYFAGHVPEVNEHIKGYGCGELISEGVIQYGVTDALRTAGYTPPYL